MNHYLVAYDVASTTVRNRCLRACRAHADTRQKSVLELAGASEQVFGLVDALGGEIAAGDRLLLARVLPGDHAWRYGVGMAPIRNGLLLVR